jgi:hypothetical protein
MPFKPIKRRNYEKELKKYGWSIRKSSIDWDLIDENGNKTGISIKITHPGAEVSATSVQKTHKKLTERGKLDA